MRHLVFVVVVTATLATAACSDSAGSHVAPTRAVAATELDGGAADDGATFESGTELRVVVPDEGRVFVDLDTLASVPSDDPARLWDLAFEGKQAFTNGGVSGPGEGAAFGPLDGAVFLGDAAPSVPFLTTDRTGGAFLDWYLYEGAPNHALWSRFHVVGVRDGDRLFKVQILGYYGERDGAAVSALYRVRWAELGPTGPGPTEEIADLDASAGGAQALETEPSACLDLATGARAELVPAEARTSRDWHLCFRRQSISVNGGLAGPRGAVANDRHAEETASETLDVVRRRTADSERARFDAVGAGDFEGRSFTSDGVVSAFGDAWLVPGSAWLVQSAHGGKKFLVAFRAFEGASERSAGTVVMRVKPVKG